MDEKKPPRGKRRVAREHNEQAALIRWANLKSTRALYPDLDKLFAIPNGGKRCAITGKMLKAEGVSPGYPDLGVDAAKCGYHGLRIELKAPKTGRVSKEQKAWHERLAMAGYLCVVCFGWESAKSAIENYLRAR